MLLWHNESFETSCKALNKELQVKGALEETRNHSSQTSQD